MTRSSKRSFAGAAVQVAVQNRDQAAMEVKARKLLLGRMVTDVKVTGDSITIEVSGGGRLNLHYDHGLRMMQ